jgi:putative ATP-dependent endonuclease of OLD family
LRIQSLRIENFRGFKDEIIRLNPYTCFVGPNGAGKSTVLTALNVFFQERTGSINTVSKLTDEDYFNRDTTIPVRITLTFTDLSEKAREDLIAYVRNDVLVVTAEAVFDETSRGGVVRHYGQRLGMEEFRLFFDGIKANKKAAELNPIYDAIRRQFQDLSDARSVEAKAEALKAYESAHLEACVLIPSADDFYGVNSTGKLKNFMQWVYIPAVKDATEEEQEARNTAFGKLIARTVRAKTNFDAELDLLKTDTLARYGALLDRNKGSLEEISHSLQKRLGSWAHGNVRLEMEWLSDPEKSVTVQQPVAGIKTGEGDFLGSLSRMGHGLQRSYLFALLQELAAYDVENAPTLILGVEEPELYQHPPQARHLVDVFTEMAEGNNQILVTTHSPLFLSGEGFENARLVKGGAGDTGASVKGVKFECLCRRIREARGDNPDKPIDGLVAKIHQALQPNIAEMFFTRIPVLVEGLEDVSYIATELHLSSRWEQFRRLGCHLIVANGKDKLIQPMALAKELDLPVFLVFDSDGDETQESRREKHARDNSALISLLDAGLEPFPAENVIGENYAIWQSNLGSEVKTDFGAEHTRFLEGARTTYHHEGGLEKHDLFIAEWLSTARSEGLKSEKLDQLCNAILSYAESVVN